MKTYHITSRFSFCKQKIKPFAPEHISYKLKSPFCYTKVDSSMSSMSPVSAKSTKNWELIENTELNGKFTTISVDSKKEPSELRTSAENTGLKTYKNQSVQVGCTECTIFELLQAHRSEVVGIREQIRYVRETLTKNAPPKK